MTQTFRLDIVPYSLNNYRNAHHMKLHAIKRDVGESVHWQLLKKARKCLSPVSITFIFHWSGNRKHDLDNYCASAKLILDALTPPNAKKGYGVGIIPDDNSEIITELRFLPGTRKDDTIDLIIKEILL